MALSGKGLISVSQEFFASIARIFILVRGAGHWAMGTGVSFYEALRFS